MAVSNVSFFPRIDREAERRKRLSEVLAKTAPQPTNTEVIGGYAVKQSPLAGLARALSTGLAGYQEGKAVEEEKTRENQARQTMANALEAYNRSQAGGETITPQGETISWNKQDPRNAGQMYANLLMQNSDTADLGMMSQINQMQGQQDLYNEIEAYKAKAPYELDLARQKAMIEAQYAAPPVSVREFIYAQQNPEFAAYQKSTGGGSKIWQDAQNLVAASEAAGTPMDLMTAYSIAKSGLGVGRTMVEGSAAPVPGALDTAQQFKYVEGYGGSMGDAAGKEMGAAAANLNSLQAQLPRLEQVVQELSDLGKVATYTQAGQLEDTLQRQAGLPVGEDAVARTEYVSKVDNEILPLLRQTFGAQFTQKEGESLKATLGDVNKSPEEKDAVLRSFIQQKTAQIATLQRQTGQQGQGSNPAITTPYDQIQPQMEMPTIQEGTIADGPNGSIIFRGGRWVPYE